MVLTLFTSGRCVPCAIIEERLSTLTTVSYAGKIPTLEIERRPTFIPDLRLPGLYEW